jgi:hypothetical protein
MKTAHVSLYCLPRHLNGKPTYGWFQEGDDFDPGKKDKHALRVLAEVRAQFPHRKVRVGITDARGHTRYIGDTVDEGLTGPAFFAQF